MKFLGLDCKSNKTYFVTKPKTFELTQKFGKRTKCVSSKAYLTPFSNSQRLCFFLVQY